MLDEVVGDLVQAVVGGDDLVVFAEQLLEQGLLVGIQLGLLDLGGDAVVEVQPRDAELLAAIFVHQLDRGAVLLRPLEVVARDIVAEDAPGQLVVLDSGVPVKPMKAAFGRATRMLRASLPAWVRCASSEITMMSSRSL